MGRPCSLLKFRVQAAFKRSRRRGDARNGRFGVRRCPLEAAWAA